MASPTIRAAYSLWPEHNRALRVAVASLTDQQLAIRPTPERWPLWATIGHVCCQRVFGLCLEAGAPGAADSPFPNSGFDCPGDDDLQHVWSVERLVNAIDRTFAIVDWCLDHWTVDSLGDVISHPDWGRPDTTRGRVVQRSYSHDVSHITELNESLSRAGLPLIDLFP